MIALKDYQVRVLDSLRDFLQRCSRGEAPAAAYNAVQLRNSAAATPYISVPAAGLDQRLPYVCVRVPTGGGKTLLACYAAGLATTELLQAERSVVLWLVPSSTILDQTADALRDVRHPYRRALELAVGGVEVLTIEEALRVSRATVDGATVVVVATIQSFRVEDTAGRKVYEQNTFFTEHLLNLPADRWADMLMGPDGKPVPSLVNMLRLRRPIVIVDEGHNARTELSFTTLGNVLPSCIIEFTATPARIGTPSNVLHRVSAAELKAAEMVKLPLRVITRHLSQRHQLLSDAIALRADLERLATAEAQETGEYIRPILLIQAERVDSCELLRDRLVEAFGVARDEVKISVGSLDELRSIKDILHPTCPVRFIITVQKLREGWDCPFAYVLCSLRDTRSANAIEQIVGRILRLPQARTKKHPDLNCSYAFSVSTSIAEVLSELRDALEANGFTATEAERIIIPVQGELPLGAQPKTVSLSPGDIDLTAGEVELRLGGRVRINSATGEITVLVPLSEEETRQVTGCIKTDDARARVEQAIRIVAETDRAWGGSGKPRPATPYERQLDFVVPRLSAAVAGELFEFESTVLLEHPWKLSAKSATLPETYNPMDRPALAGGIVDVGRLGDVQVSVARHGEADFVSSLHQHALELGGESEWSLDTLVAWLDRHINHQDISIGESAEFLRKVVRGLMTRIGTLDFGSIAIDRFRLRDEVERLIDHHRTAERKSAFQQWLLPSSALVVTRDVSINFKTVMYEPSFLYEGSFKFERHYFGPRPGELVERTPGGQTTEEFRCAQFIDSMAAVQFWLRNLARKASSFRLQTSGDWFYPDFVCQLTDGRVLVVEYKGSHLYADAEEKRAVGAVWASRSKGTCLFVMPTNEDFSTISAAIKNAR